MRAKSLLCRKDPGARRLTKDEVMKLKVASQSPCPSIVPFAYKLESAFNSILHYFTFSAGLKKNQCIVYGHILPRESTVLGYGNCCRECGVQVTETEQLRRSTVG